MKKIISVIPAFCLMLSSICYADNTSEIMKQARQGNAEAQFKAASLYASGKIGKKDEEVKN